jgi:hypothetical protein
MKAYKPEGRRLEDVGRLSDGATVGVRKGAVDVA